MTPQRTRIGSCEMKERRKKATQGSTSTESQGGETRQKEKLTAVRLIRLVLAVGISITLPGQPHTLPVGTAELRSSAVGPAVRQVRDPIAAAALRTLV